MSTKDSALVKGFFFFVLLLLLGIAITVYTQTRTLTPAKAASVAVNPTALVPPTPVAARPQKTEIDSAKADQKLVLVATPGQNGTTAYTFSITDFNGNNPRPLLTRTLGPGATMSLPWNAWDPTDTYVFIAEQNSGQPPDFFVLRADGQPIVSGQQAIDVGSVWTAKDPGYTIRTATGWASGTLLIVYTSKNDGTNGPSFWFEIPDTAIIQLAR